MCVVYETHLYFTGSFKENYFEQSYNNYFFYEIFIHTSITLEKFFSEILNLNLKKSPTITILKIYIKIKIQKASNDIL